MSLFNEKSPVVDNDLITLAIDFAYSHPKRVEIFQNKWKNHTNPYKCMIHWICYCASVTAAISRNKKDGLPQNAVAAKMIEHGGFQQIRTCISSRKKLPSRIDGKNCPIALGIQGLYVSEQLEIQYATDLYQRIYGKQVTQQLQLLFDLDQVPNRNNLLLPPFESELDTGVIP